MRSLTKKPLFLWVALGTPAPGENSPGLTTEPAAWQRRKTEKLPDEGRQGRFHWMWLPLLLFLIRRMNTNINYQFLVFVPIPSYRASLPTTIFIFIGRHAPPREWGMTISSGPRSSRNRPLLAKIYSQNPYCWGCGKEVSINYLHQIQERGALL